MELSLFISIGIFAAVWLLAIISSLLKYNGKRHTEKILFIGTFISGMILFCALNSHSFDHLQTAEKWSNTVLASLRQAMGMFTIEGNYSDVASILSDGGAFALLDGRIKDTYVTFAVILYAIAPILTFGFILSFIKNAAAHIRYTLSFYKEAHVFSELNEKTLALAKSLLKGDGSGIISRDIIVFTDVFNKEGDESAEIIEEAKKIGAVLFSKDLASIKYKSKLSRRRLNFYLISENEAEKTAHIEHIIESYNYDRTKLFVFSDSTETTLYLQSYAKVDKEPLKIEVVRINDIRSLIYHDLNDNGLRLFENAKPQKDSNRKITAVIFGLGKYGSEMLRALFWYCQVPGYTVHIKAYDEREDVKEAFLASCPDITLDKEFTSENGARYKIEVSTFNADGCDFTEVLKGATLCFVCLGNDDINLRTAMRARCAAEKLGQTNTDVKTVIYDSNIKERICYDYGEAEPTRDDMRYYKINIIGDINSFYSKETVINSELIRAGFAVHSRWESSTGVLSRNRFFMNDYNFFSSLASALHDGLYAKIYEKITASEEYCKEYFPQFTKGKLGEVNQRYLLDMTHNETAKTGFSRLIDASSRAIRAMIAYIRFSELSKSRATLAEELLAKHYLKNSPTKSLPHAFEIATKHDVFSLDPSLERIKQGAKDSLDLLCDLYTILRTNVQSFGIAKSDFTYESLSAKEKAALSKYLEEIDFVKFIDSSAKNGDSANTYGISSLSVDFLSELGDCAAAAEHIRWLAYMLSSGFTYAEQTKNEFKMHSNLVSSDKLLLLDKLKDI